MKQYIGIVRDHSISMSSLARSAARDYNTNIAGIKEAALANNLDTIVSTVMCGIRVGRETAGKVKRDVVNSNVHALVPIPELAYITDGYSTPLLDAVGDLITLLESVPDANDPEVSFLLIVITDGQENASKIWNSHSITDKIRKLQFTDRWTFTFRVPRGEAHTLTNLGIPAGNILEWEQTQHGLETAARDTVAAVSNYFVGRTRGVTKSTAFYADLGDVPIQKIIQNLVDITGNIKIWPVINAGSEIRTFVEDYNNEQYLKAAAFYELTKSVTVQDYKSIVIYDRTTGNFYGGASARQLLGLPDVGSVKLRPGDHGQYKIYIQSTSVNRKLIKGTKVVYWAGAVLGT